MVVAVAHCQVRQVYITVHVTLYTCGIVVTDILISPLLHLPILSLSLPPFPKGATNSPRQSSFRNGKNKSPAEKKKKGKDKTSGSKINSADIEIVQNDAASVSEGAWLDKQLIK